MIDRILSVAAELHRRQPGSRVEPLPDTKLEMLASGYDGLPKDYLLFLKHYGCGSIGDGDLMIYGGLINPSDVYGPIIARRLPGILLVGDNFSGDCLGYDTTSNWRLAWISSDGEWAIDDSNHTLIDFIEDWFLRRDDE